MQSRSIPIYFPMLMLLVTCACRARDTETGDISPTCYYGSGKNRVFAGNIECMRTLPERRISGYWVVDHEYSVFYRTKQEIKSGFDSDATWLDFEHDLQRTTSIYFNKNGRHVYHIDFVGSEAFEPGTYGNGLFHKGALVRSINRLEELP